MNFSKKLLMCVALLCVVSFAQQSTTTKAAAQAPIVASTIVNSDSQKTLKKIDGVVKPPANTWTKIKDLFM